MKSLNVSNLYDHYVLDVMHCTVNYNKNIHLFNDLLCHSEVYSYNTRNFTNVTTLRFRRASQMSIAFTGLKLLISIPATIKSSTTISAFKQSRKGYMDNQN